MDNLLTDSKQVRVSNAVAAGVTAITSAVVDLQGPAPAGQGYDGVMFIAFLNTVVGGCQLGLQVQDAAASGGPFANVGTQTTYADIAGESSNKMLVVDVVNIQGRFVQAVLTRTTQNATVDAIVAIPYRAKRKPTVADASVVASQLSNAAS